MQKWPHGHLVLMRTHFYSYNNLLRAFRCLRRDKTVHHIRKHYFRINFRKSKLHLFEIERTCVHLLYVLSFQSIAGQHLRVLLRQLKFLRSVNSECGISLWRKCIDPYSGALLDQIQLSG